MTNILTKTMLLVAILITLPLSNVFCAEPWVTNGTKWYILYHQYVLCNTDTRCDGSETDDISVYVPTVTGNITSRFNAWNEDNTANWPTYKINVNGSNAATITDSPSKTCGTWGNRYCGGYNNRVGVDFAVNSTTTVVKGRNADSNGALTKKYCEIIIPLPNHVNLISAAEDSYNFSSSGVTEIYTSTSHEFDFDYFKSYYPSGSISIKIEGIPGQTDYSSMFHLGSATGGQGTVDIVASGTVYASTTCFTDATINANKPSKKTIYYAPTAGGTHEAYVNIYYNNAVIKKIKIKGECNWPEVNCGTQNIGLAKNTTYTMNSGFIITSNATVTVGQKTVGGSQKYIDYFVSSDGVNWGTTATIPTTKKIYIKFQPSDETALHTGELKITSGGNTYFVNVTGQGTVNNANKGAITVLKYAMYGPESGDWYMLRDGNTSGKYDRLELTYPVTVSITNNPNGDFRLGNYSSNSDVFSANDLVITPATATSSAGFRVGLFPQSATSTAQQCTVTFHDDSGDGKTYTFTVKYTSASEITTSKQTVNVGKASEYQTIDMGTFRGFTYDSDNKGGTATVMEDADLLYSTTGSGAWSKSITISNGSGKMFYVKYVPQSATSGEVTKTINIKDNLDGNRIYHVKVKGEAVATTIQVPGYINTACSPVGFKMDNFTCAGNVQVDASKATDFVVSSSSNGTYATSTTIGAQGTFYVKMVSTTQLGSKSGTIALKDLSTGRTYNVAVQGTVDKIPSTITISNGRIYLFPDDHNVHEMVGNDYIVHGNPKAIEPGITLSVPAGDAQYLEVVEGNKLRVKTGFTLTTNRDITVTASYGGSTTHAAAESKTFVVRITAMTELNNSRAWTKEGNKWYVFNYTDLLLSNLVLLTYVGEYNYNINVYLPNVACSNQYFAVRNGLGWTQVANCPFSTQLFCSDEADQIAYLSGVTTRDYDDAGNHTTITLPARGDDAQLYTYTNRFDNPQCDPTVGNVHYKYSKIEIEVPRHYHKMKDSESVDFGDVQVGEVAYKDVKLNGTNGLFKSFLTTNGLTIAPAAGCPAVFYIEPATEGQSKALVPANYVLSPYNKIDSYSGLVLDKDGNYYIRIYFKPLADGQAYNGAFVLSDDGMTLTINVTGNGLTTANEPQYISWSQDLSRLTGSGSMNLTAASNSGLNVSYSGGGTGITLSGSQLNYSGNNTANITASCNAGVKNNVSYDAATPVTKRVTVYTTTPAPGTCGAEEIRDPNAWRKNNQNSPYTMPATAGFTWNGTGTATQMTFDISLVNCATATVKLYVNGTGTGNEIGTFTSAGSKSINLTGRSITSGSTFYCSFYGASGSTEQNATVSMSITNIQIYYSPDAQQITTGPVDFGTQRVAQAGVTRNIEAIKFSGMNGILSASITGTDADCFALLNDKNPVAYTTTCDEIIAAYDVRFVPKRVGNNLTAYLHVVDPLGEAVDIQLTGKAVKRDIKLGWAYAENAITINAVGSGNSKSLSVDDNAYIYDKLRGTTAKLKIAPNYTVENGTVQMLQGESGNIIKVNLDGNGYITSIEATGKGSGTAYVIADASVITSSHELFNTTSDICTLTVNVQKVAPEINFDPESLTLTYPQEAAAGETFTVTSNDDNVDVKWSYSVSPATGRITVTRNDNVFTIKPLEDAGSATITVTASETALYTSGSKDFPVTVEWGEMTLTLDVSKLDLSSVTHEEEIANTPGFITTNYPASSTTVTFSITSWTGDNTTGYLDGTNKKLTLKQIGKIELNVTATHTKGQTKTVGTGEIDVRVGTLVFDNHANDSKWKTVGNWSPHYDRVPDNVNFDVLISTADCYVDDASVVAQCRDLTINGSGKLEIAKNCVANILRNVTNSDASKLVLKADISSSATLLFGEGQPKATVESCIKGTLHPLTEPEGTHNNPDWQYRGFLGSNPQLNAWNVAICEWQESRNATNCWGTDMVYSPNGGSYNGAPWTGYGMANYGTENTIYTYTTTLLPTTEHTYTITRTSSGTGEEFPNFGVNLITNSWSAPIDIEEFVFGNNVEATVYFYQTRSHRAWEFDKTGAFVVYPQMTGEIIYQTAGSSQIASSQSFLVRTNVNGGTLSVGSEAFVAGASGAMYAPAQREEFNILKMTMSIDSIGDDLYLLESERCTKEFENGYDGTKMMENGRPQIFATNSYGYTAVNADSTLLGQKIGYAATAEGATCTITFDAERLEGYRSLYLYDRVAKRYADILAGESYTFTGSKEGEKERFEIVGQRDDGTEFVTSRDRNIEVVGRQALLSGFDGESQERVIITDMKGNRIWSEDVAKGPWFDLPDMPAGAYIIYCGNVKTKFIWK